MTEYFDEPVDHLTDISATELAHIAELLSLIDEFLRHDRVPELLATYQRTTGCSHPGYDAAQLIDQISFTAHALRRHHGAPTSPRRRSPVLDDAHHDIGLFAVEGVEVVGESLPG